jgi:hypothetical protein
MSHLAAGGDQRVSRHFRLPRISAGAIVAALLALQSALLVTSMLDESPVTDEPNHLTRGLAWFWGPDTTLSWAHPPLGNLVAALPVVLSADRVEMGKFRSYRGGDVYSVATDLFDEKYDQRRSWFFEGRAVVALLSVVLAFYVYRLGTRLFGVAVGLCSLGFFVLHPTLLAHGRLVTTDMPVTVAMTVAVGELITFLKGGSRWHGAAAALGVSAAIVTKYTGLALVPLATLAVLCVMALRAGRYRAMPRTKALLGAGTFVVLSAGLALFTINAVYRFEHTGATVAELLNWPEPSEVGSKKNVGKVLESGSFIAKLPGWMPIPLPYTFVFGLAHVQLHSKGGHPSVFFGERTREGHPGYFPTLLLIKTPIVQLLALAWAGVLFCRKRGRVSLPSALLLGYALCFLLLAIRSGINIGIRHVLPLLPILTLFAALGATHAWRSISAERLRLPLAAAAVALSLIGMAWSFPDYLSDFNVLVGGRRGGERISIVGEEWGQDMARLARALRKRGIEAVKFSGDSFMSRRELARLNIDSMRMRCPKKFPDDAYYAVRARDRARVPCKTLEKRSPLFEVNGHVFVYGPRRQAKHRKSP